MWKYTKVKLDGQPELEGVSTCQNFHNDEEVKFRMEITKKFKDALTRQADEAVRIFSQPGHQLLNSKSEFNHPPLARVVVEKKNKWGYKTQGVKTVT